MTDHQEEVQHRLPQIGPLLLALLLASFSLGLNEFALMPRGVRAQLEQGGLHAKYAPAVSAYFMPTLLLIGVVFYLVFLTTTYLSKKRAAAEHLTALVVAVVSAPYSIYLGRYLFSGPRVRTVSYQPALVFGATIVLIGLFYAFCRILVWRYRETRYLLPVTGASLVAQVSALVINQAILPNEYLPLHGLVTFAGMSGAYLGAFEVSRRLLSASSSEGTSEGRTTVRARHWQSALLLVVILLLFSYGRFQLGRSFAVGWLVAGESAAARYLPTFRGGDTDEGGSATLEGTLKGATLRPQLSDPQKEAGLRELRSKEKAPHIVIFSIDNVQADRVGAYGYKTNPTTPIIDELAQSGMLFKDAYSHYPGTRVFLSAMLTGRRIPAITAHRMPSEYQEQSLTKLLKKRDYHVLVQGVFELTAYREFDPKPYAIDTNLRRETAQEIRKSKTIPHTPLSVRLLGITEHVKEAHAKQKPTFIWLHMLQPHRHRGSFVSSKEFPFGDSLDAKYDSAIATTESWIKTLRKVFAEELRDDRETIWVIMSDHGAGMTRGDKKDTGKTLFNDQVHVPLIISGPGIKRGVIEGPVDSALDMSATLLDLVGVTPPKGYDGISLVPLLEGRAESSPLFNRIVPLRSGSWTGAVFGNKKLIIRGEHLSLYDFSADPLEDNNLADKDPKTAEELRKLVQRVWKQADVAHKSGMQK